MSEENARRALDEEGRIISLYEAAEILGTSYPTAMGLAKSGELKAFRIRKTWRPGRTIVKAWIAWMNEEKGYSAKTVNLRLTALKSLLRYCSAEDSSLTSAYVGACAVRPPRSSRVTTPTRRPERPSGCTTASASSRRSRLTPI